MAATYKTIEWKDLGLRHIGLNVWASYPARNRFDIGTIIGIRSDSAQVVIDLQNGVELRAERSGDAEFRSGAILNYLSED